jgi:serine protease Do
MVVEELWSPKNEVRLQAFLKAVHHNQWLDGLLEIEGASFEKRKKVRYQLQSWSRRVRDLGVGTTPQAQAEVLGQVLGAEAGLRGDNESYESMQNSLLSHVIDRRKGLPILLSLIWIMVGQSSGIQVEGIGLPGHFIARIGGPQGCLVDPFGQGVEISENDCRAIVTSISKGRITWQDSFLKPPPTTVVFERVLRNLINALGRMGDIASVYRFVKFACTIRPNSPDLQFEFAMLAEQLGDRESAVVVYTDLLRRFQGSTEATFSEFRLDALKHRPVPN